MALSLRTRLLLILLGLTLVSILAVSLFTVDAFSRLGRTAQDRSSEALSAQVEGDLAQFNTAAASENDHFFAEISSQAQVIAGFISAQYSQGLGAAAPSDLPVDLRMSLFPGGQYANDNKELSSIFVPNFQPFNSKVARDVQLSKNLEQLLPGISKQLPSVVALYFGSQNEVLRYYPNINIGEALPPDFKVTSRPWYVKAVESGSKNGSALGTTSWSEPYQDATGLGIVTTAAVAIYDQSGQILGVVGLDITLSDILSAVESNNLVQEGYSILVDNQGRGLVMPAQAYRDLLNRERQENEFAPDLSTSDQSFQEIVNRMKAGEDGLEHIDVGGKQLLVAFSPLSTTGWSLASIVEPSLVLSSVDMLQNELSTDARNLLLMRMLPLTIGLALIIIMLGLIFTNRWLRPIKSLSTAAQQIAAGDYDINLPPSTADELGVLSGAFGTMKESIQSTLNSLEQRVAERTNQLQRRTAQLAAAADIARDITQTRDLDRLLSQTVNQIHDRFDYYHAGIFLLDNSQEYAVLRAANSQGGMELIKQGHRLRVGKTSIVGYVVETGQPRIALDTGTDAVHFKNPLLPETRSEAALPLIINVGHTTSGSGVESPRVIGVLDVQSKEANAFEEGDITALEIMADQLAVALNNASLFSEYQKSLEELQKLYSQLNRDVWSRLAQNRLLVGYEFNPTGTSPIYSDSPARLMTRQPDADKSTLESGIEAHALQIRVRGETVAILEVWPGDKNFSSEEIRLLEELAERLSLALESARLYEDAQNRAAREQVINQFSAELADTIDLNALLQAAVHQIGSMPNVTEASIRIKPS
jgi:GAF domain-containing protein/HAMP domain-containing protein